MPIARLRSTLGIYRDRHLITILFLGFSSGLPLALTGATLTAWLKESGIDIASISLFAAVATPYAFKFAWSPLIDGLRFPILSRLLGRRRGWMLATQLLLAASIILLGFAEPATAPWAAAWVALALSTASASQDIVIDAYRVEILKPEQYGAGAAMVTLGYRIGMLASGAGALFLADYLQTGLGMDPQHRWQWTYIFMAALMGVGILTTLIAQEPPNSTLPPVHSGALFDRVAGWLKDSVIAPFADFMKRPGWLALLAFIILYKLGDAVLGIMTTPFLLEIGFAKSQIASIMKLYGFVATIIGSFIGASLVGRFGMVGPLVVCGIGHALTNLMFVVQVWAGADPFVLALGITLENLTGGMSAAVFVAFISSLCNVHYTATQYALLSSLAAIGRTLFATTAGAVAKSLGWEMFFVLCVLLAFPSLGILWWMRRKGLGIGETASPGNY